MTYQPHPAPPTPHEDAIDIWAAHEHAVVEYRLKRQNDLDPPLQVIDLHDRTTCDGWGTVGEIAFELGPIVYPSLADYRASRGWTLSSVLLALGLDAELVGDEVLDLERDLGADPDWRSTVHDEPYEWGDLPPGFGWWLDPDAPEGVLGYVDIAATDDADQGRRRVAGGREATHAAAWAAYQLAHVPRGFTLVEDGGPGGLWCWRPVDWPDLPDQEPTTRAEALAAAWQEHHRRSCEIVLDLLGLTAMVWPEDFAAEFLPSTPVEDAVMRERERWIASWTLLERGKAIEWAGAVHAGASDNDGVIVPPRPGHLDRGRPA